MKTLTRRGLLALGPFAVLANALRPTVCPDPESDHLLEIVDQREANTDTIYVKRVPTSGDATVTVRLRQDVKPGELVMRDDVVEIL